VNENKLSLGKENVDHQLNQEEEESFKCIFCGETGTKYLGFFSSSSLKTREKKIVLLT
jgi:redox-regulated HSP33 family molecular chaperone